MDGELELALSFSTNAFNKSIKVHADLWRISFALNGSNASPMKASYNFETNNVCIRVYYDCFACFAVIARF